MTRDLFASGMVYKNTISPIGCGLRINSDLKISPERVPFSPKEYRVEDTVTIKTEKSPMASQHNNSRKPGWFIAEP